MSIILPLSRPEIGRTPPPGQPIQMTHARRKSPIATPLYLPRELAARPGDRFELVAATRALAAANGSVFAPAIAAVTLGIVGPKAFSARTGRNEAAKIGLRPQMSA
ncbi:hypothetical protein [Bradyrhizobium sp. USDA 4506]